jgi:hypothetical protein
MNPRMDDARSGSSQTSAVSAVSWPAIIAGAFVAAAVTLLLLVLGTGLGVAAISPWPARNLSAGEFAAASAAWLIVMQWVSAGLGGYVAGRLRTRWVGTHTHEVFFRDTAHGLVTWAVATVMVAVAVAAAGSLPLAEGRDMVAAAASSTGVSADKAAAHAAIFTALAMLVGAFIASVSAALGGRQRDEHL